MAFESSALARGVRRLLGVGDPSDLAAYRALLDDVNRREPRLRELSDPGLLGRAAVCRSRLHSAADTDDAVAEGFALVREAARRVLGERPHDEQVLAGLAMHAGCVAEMQTGEGKTLAAVAPAFVSGLAGHGVHVLTFNDYLARRDAEWMGPVYSRLGLEVGFVREGMASHERRRAYRCDVTYVTAKEAGFDLLRDLQALDPDDTVHRPFAMALVDEADSILIDEARIPLVIAGTAEGPGTGLGRVATLARRLTPGEDFDFDEHSHNVFLTDVGAARAERLLGCANLFEPDSIALLTDLRNALHAHAFLLRDRDYIVRSGRIELVDDFTGRVAENRHWPDGLQSALEAKEGLELQDEGRILDSITLQHFLALYPRLCGMTATASPAAEELRAVYGLPVVRIPTHVPSRRIDHPDVIFTHREAKRRALVEEVAQVHGTGRPVLVGTASVAESEDLAAELEGAGVPCQVLNARNDEAEAEVVARAGRLGAVTISTNMAGRGTDIRLGGPEGADRERVAALGGLYVIGTNRHESRRIDDQLRGRAGRQGDPGSSRFMVSLEDDLMVRYGVSGLIPEALLPERCDEPLDSDTIRAEIARTQRIVEGEAHDIRTQLLGYSEVLEQQRALVRRWRQEVLEGSSSLDLLESVSPERWMTAVSDLGEQTARAVERRLTLLAIDRCWSDHLAEARRIHHGIHVVRFVGKTPLAEYCRELAASFETLRERIDDDVVRRFESLDLESGGVDWDATDLSGPSSTWTYLVHDSPFGSNLLMDLSNRAGFALWAALLHAPLLLAYGLYLHWRRRRRRP